MYKDLDAVYDRPVDTTDRRPRWWLDPAICLALMAFGLFAITLDPTIGHATVVDSFVMPAAILPILWRWRAPLAAAAAFPVGVLVAGLPTYDQVLCGFAIPVGLLILFAIGSRLERNRALRASALVLSGLALLLVIDPIFKGDALGGALFILPLVAVVWTAARVVFSRERLVTELVERTRLLERRREQTARLAVEMERTRLATELDVGTRDRVRELIALARTGERSPTEDAEGSRALFARIERDGRESLDEMRGLLGVLRSDDRGGRSPRPTLAQIETLLEDARAGGCLVDLEVEGERRPLPDGVELAAYRALQHALVAVGGDGGEPATVQLRYLADSLELEISGLTSEGGGAEAALAAARERVMAHGGSFSAHARPLGRRVLRAHLPVPAHG